MVSSYMGGAYRHKASERSTNKSSCPDDVVAMHSSCRSINQPVALIATSSETRVAGCDAFARRFTMDDVLSFFKLFAALSPVRLWKHLSKCTVVPRTHPLQCFQFLPRRLEGMRKYSRILFSQNSLARVSSAPVIFYMRYTIYSALFRYSCYWIHRLLFLSPLYLMLYLRSDRIRSAAQLAVEW